LPRFIPLAMLPSRARSNGRASLSTAAHRENAVRRRIHQANTTPRDAAGANAAAPTGP
jgi:hypothetical protein